MESKGNISEKSVKVARCYFFSPMVTVKVLSWLKHKNKCEYIN